MLKIIALAVRKEQLAILKKKLERDYGTVWAEGPFPDREGQGWKTYLTLEVPDDDK